MMLALHAPSAPGPPPRAHTLTAGVCLAPRGWVPTPPAGGPPSCPAGTWRPTRALQPRTGGRRTMLSYPTWCMKRAAAWTSPTNRRFPTFWTKAEDAFAQAWDYPSAVALRANPPFSHLDEVVTKASREGCLMLVVAGPGSTPACRSVCRGPDAPPLRRRGRLRPKTWARTSWPHTRTPCPWAAGRRSSTGNGAPRGLTPRLSSGPALPHWPPPRRGPLPPPAGPTSGNTHPRPLGSRPCRRARQTQGPAQVSTGGRFGGSGCCIRGPHFPCWPGRRGFCTEHSGPPPAGRGAPVGPRGASIPARNPVGTDGDGT